MVRPMSVMSALERRFCCSPPWNAVARRVVLPWAVQRSRLEGRVLEVGAGSGAMAAGVLESHPIAEITVTDLDPKMVERASARLGGHGARGRARVADARRLPFEDGAFDAAVSFLMLHHVGGWEQALREMARVVRPGGRLFVYDLLESRLWGLAHGISRSDGIRMVTLAELERVLADLPLRDVRVRSRGRLWFRLAATLSE